MNHFPFSKRWYLFFFPLLFFFGMIFLVQQSVPSESVIRFPNGDEILVNVARTKKQQTRGLSGRDSLPENEGLLFVHEKVDYQSYWMKEMLFPIDIIWIKNNQIVGFVENAQPQEPPLTIYTSPVPVDKVLEVNAGFVEENAINVGDILDIPPLNK